MTWDELAEVARNAISSELNPIPKTLAERVAKRIVEDVKIEFAKVNGYVDETDSLRIVEAYSDE